MATKIVKKQKSELRKLGAPNKLFVKCLSACIESAGTATSADKTNDEKKALLFAIIDGANEAKLNAALKYAFKKLKDTKTWWKISETSIAYNKYFVEDRYLVVETLLDAGGSVQVLEDLFRLETQQMPEPRLTDLMIAKGTKVSKFSVTSICLHAARQGKLELMRTNLSKYFYNSNKPDKPEVMLVLQQSGTVFKYEIYTYALKHQRIDVLRYLFASYNTVSTVEVAPAVRNGVTVRDRLLSWMMGEFWDHVKNPSKELLELFFVELKPDSPTLNLLTDVADAAAKHCSLENFKWFLDKEEKVTTINGAIKANGGLNYLNRCLLNSYNWNNLPVFQYLLNVHKTQLEQLSGRNTKIKREKRSQLIYIYLEDDQMFHFPRDPDDRNQNGTRGVKPNVESIRVLYRHFLYCIGSNTNANTNSDTKELMQSIVERSKTPAVLELSSSSFRADEAGIFNMLSDNHPQNPDECILTLWLQGVDLSSHPRFNEREQVLKTYREKMSEELITTKLLILPLFEIFLQFV